MGEVRLDVRLGLFAVEDIVGAQIEKRSTPSPAGARDIVRPFSVNVGGKLRLYFAIIHGSERRTMDHDIRLGLIESPIHGGRVSDIRPFSGEWQDTVALLQAGYEIPAQHPCTACYKDSQSVLYPSE